MGRQGTRKGQRGAASWPWGTCSVNLGVFRKKRGKEGKERKKKSERRGEEREKGEGEGEKER